ncbi:DUF3668 domain-containing protein [Lamellibrachia satsuma]|nr:DUF3668 domain-containing protein [Lamellibrachia satsuma]
MVEKNRFLLVVSVLHGRHFPKRPKHKLIAEVRFDGELLTTDATEHVETPDFTQELAWELDKKALHQHRLQRSSVKVQLYAVSTATTMKEAVGFVILDLRAAQSQQTFKWYPLLHSKYSSSKPEVRLGIYIDDDTKGGNTSFKAKEPPARVGDYGVEFDLKQLRPILDDIDGFYQIGPREKCSEQFVLSVTVAFASNLLQLIPTTIPLPSTGFFFYYSMFGNDVTNEVFHDLVKPTFPAERASVTLRSSVEALTQFFSNQPGIEIHLCCGNQSLGSTEVPLGPLLHRGSTEIYMKPVSIEGAFELHPPSRVKEQLAPVPEDMKPIVGLAVVLRKEEQMMSHTPVKQTKSPERARKESPQRAPAKPAVSSPKAKKQSPKVVGKKAPRRSMSPPRSPPSPHEGSYTETFETSTSKTDDNVSELRDNYKQAEPIRDAAKAAAKSPSSKTPPGGKGVQQRDSPTVPVMFVDHRPPSADDVRTTSTESSSHRHLVVPAEPHHFSFSIDLRSIHNVNTDIPLNIFLRYRYPFFGSAAPIITHPAVEVRKGTEVLLPQSFCAFEFATTLPQLNDTFVNVPLLIEVWDKEKQKSQTSMIGATQLPLSNVLSSEKTRAVHANGDSGWRQLWSGHVPFFTAESGEAHKMGELDIVLSLEDWGTINLQQVVTKDGTVQGSGVPDANSGSTTGPAPSGPTEVPTDYRETMEYKAALELEMWKEQEEGKFEDQLKMKEKQLMQALSVEWKRRDKEREVLVKKKVSEYSVLEKKLQKTLNDLEKREQQLSSKEQEVLRLRKELQREHERKLTEMREASRRLKEDCDHKIQLERERMKEMEEHIGKLKQQLSEAEERYHRLDAEFASYRSAQSGKPEVKLQSEINLLTLEKVELERRLDAVTKSKVHYKQQWGRSLKELARLKQKEQVVARAQLRRQQQELEHMRLRYLAAEEKEVVQTEKRELEDIKSELNQMKQMETARMSGQLTGTGGGGDASLMQPLIPDPPEGDDDEHVTRLIEERDTLLRTGVYSSDDRIIAELDRQIRDVIAKRGSTRSTMQYTAMDVTDR